MQSSFFFECKMVYSSYKKQRILFLLARPVIANISRIKYSKRTELIMHEIGSARAGYKQE